MVHQLRSVRSLVCGLFGGTKFSWRMTSTMDHLVDVIATDKYCLQIWQKHTCLYLYSWLRCLVQTGRTSKSHTPGKLPFEITTAWNVRVLGPRIRLPRIRLHQVQKQQYAIEYVLFFVVSVYMLLFRIIGARKSSYTDLGAAWNTGTFAPVLFHHLGQIICSC